MLRFATREALMNIEPLTLDLSPEAVRRALAGSQGKVPAVSERMQRRDEAGGIVLRVSEPPEGTTAREAAVLALLYPLNGELTVALTRRTDHLGRHSGQISFPGGAVEPVDASYWDTALRETNEELGIDVRELERWAELEPIYVPPSNYIVYPFVAHADSRPMFQPDPYEVAELIEVTLASLLLPSSFVAQLRDYQGGKIWDAHFRHLDHHIWGATAIMLDQLLGRIKLTQAEGG